MVMKMYFLKSILRNCVLLSFQCNLMIITNYAYIQVENYGSNVGVEEYNVKFLVEGKYLPSKIKVTPVTDEMPGILHAFEKKVIFRLIFFV